MTTLTDKIEDEEQKLTYGQKVADKVASFGGSWKFIISFGLRPNSRSGRCRKKLIIS